MTVTPDTSRARPKRRGIGPFSLRQLAIVVGVVAIAAVVLVAVSTPLGRVGDVGLANPQPTSVQFGPRVEGLRPGDLAPELQADVGGGSTFQLTDLDGRPIRLADLRGKAVWLNFFATWCPPCQYETPILREMDEKYRSRGLAIVSVDVQETVPDGQAYAARYGLGFTIGGDVSGHIFRKYRASALPTQFFIGPDGVIRYVVAAPMSRESATTIIEAMLPGQASAPAASASAPAAPASAAPSR